MPPTDLYDSQFAILIGDAATKLAELPADSVQTTVTSPPYWGLRDYGHEEQIGAENTPELYVAHLVQVFREVRRVLRADGTCWVNLGDSYAQAGGTGLQGKTSQRKGRANVVAQQKRTAQRPPNGYKAKDLIGIPWLVAFALRADGWYLRSDIIWHKPNPMPESVKDRPTRAHEYVFLLTKRSKYFYDAGAIKTPYAPSTITEATAGYDREGTKNFAAAGAQNGSSVKQRIIQGLRKQDEGHRRYASFNGRWDQAPNLTQGANARSVWTITPKPFKGAHFATFPPELAERCIKAGSRPGDLVLDPFGGSGTTAQAAVRLKRYPILIDVQPDYVPLMLDRIAQGMVSPTETHGAEAPASTTRSLLA